jgi:hypothetical protein
MSADNGIFIFRHPGGGLAVVHHTLSPMPMDIPDIIAKGVTCYGDKMHRCADHAQAMAKARRLLHDLGPDAICEYGILDWSDMDWEHDLHRMETYFISALDRYAMLTTRHGDVLEWQGDSETVYRLAKLLEPGGCLHDLGFVVYDRETASVRVLLAHILEDISTIHDEEGFVTPLAERFQRPFALLSWPERKDEYSFAPSNFDAITCVIDEADVAQAVEISLAMLEHGNTVQRTTRNR